MSESTNPRAISTRAPVRWIEIDNFGALGRVKLPLDRPLQIVIGPQASGKSTLAKSIYFCRKIRDYLVVYVRDIMNGYNGGEYNGEYYANFLKYLRNPFVWCFGTTRHMEDFLIRFCYDEAHDGVKAKSVTITLDADRYASFRFSDGVRAEIEDVFQEVLKAVKNIPDSISDAFSAQENILKLVRRRAETIFSDDEKLLYIPAGRNLLATIPDLIQPDSGDANSTHHYVDIRQTDVITQDFVRYIQLMRKRFGSRLEEITQNYLKTVKGQIRNRDVELACSLVRNILKADYVYDPDGEKLYYEGNKWVKLMFGSSGQQEVLWALNCIFLIILQNEKTFLVFEEPESHIFPDAQESVAQLVALMINSSESEAFLTTHSPYMLTAVNLLIYSGFVEGDSNSSATVQRQYRMKPRSVAAYMLPKSKAEPKDLINPKRGLIDALKIDGVSESINERMDMLFDKQMERKHAGKGTTE